MEATERLKQRQRTSGLANMWECCVVSISHNSTLQKLMFFLIPSTSRVRTDTLEAQDNIVPPGTMSKLRKSSKKSANETPGACANTRWTGIKDLLEKHRASVAADFKTPSLPWSQDWKRGGPLRITKIFKNGTVYHCLLWVTCKQ